MKVKMKKPLKKVWNELRVSIELPEGVEAQYNEGILTVKGPKGEVSKKLRYPGVIVSVDGKEVVIRAPKATKSEKKIIFTYRAHVKNLIKGVTEGFEYVLRVVYSKFPISVEVKDGKFIVKNFLGEKVMRCTSLPSDVDVKVNGKEIYVSGIDKEKAGQVAANIEQLTRISHLDRRVIQDGIYIIKKPHKNYV